MKRRQFILAASLLPFSQFALSSEFSNFMLQQNKEVNALDKEFDNYKSVYLAEFASYKKDIEKEWDEARTSSPSNWVSYNRNKKSRTTLDYRENSVEVAIRLDEEPTPEKINKLITEAITKPASSAIKQDPVLNKLNSQSAAIGNTVMAGIVLSQHTISKLVESAKVVNDQDSKGSYTVVTVQLPEEAKTARVRQVLPAAKKYSQEFKIGLPLVLAVIHTESAFNPLAQSHVPAFGLMQIVPNSAGKDVQKLIFKRNQAPTSSMLFNPDINIQHGCAYLSILNYRYLKAIKNKAAREHCCIAAYNTGAGNVARAFTGKTNVRSAAKIINRMSADEVYKHLRKNLKYKEARDYVYKVNKYKSIYTI